MAGSQPWDDERLRIHQLRGHHFAFQKEQHTRLEQSLRDPSTAPRLIDGAWGVASQCGDLVAAAPVSPQQVKRYKLEAGEISLKHFYEASPTESWLGEWPSSRPVI
eukprot:Protomagalhaensia_wolfi_Nauph_80__4610@NODE_4765_length_509_cov_5_029787_g3844_i0_p1_GENE_NODE_4765_length_509_cov_5_029787_g3844_i0NODE_4765_length_509_cov_5_029787_g3844_i0_p1_ORF_typecomplete_len106_score16_71_NODE_4765_length_509_cov_5_029787_g3844_i0175492